jgi:hypothetical protein
MTHDELLKEINQFHGETAIADLLSNALRAVVKLHKPKTLRGIEMICDFCDMAAYPCPTIQAIEKELA